MQKRHSNHQAPLPNSSTASTSQFSHVSNIGICLLPAIVYLQHVPDASYLTSPTSYVPSYIYFQSSTYSISYLPSSRSYFQSPILHLPPMLHLLPPISHPSPILHLLLPILHLLPPMLHLISYITYLLSYINHLLSYMSYLPSYISYVLQLALLESLESERRGIASKLPASVAVKRQQCSADGHQG